MAIKNILVAVDDEYFGRAITQYIVNQTWSADTKFHVIHIVELPEMPIKSQSYKELLELAWDTGWKLVSNVSKEIKEKLIAAHVNETVVEGNAKNHILSIATDWPADLIILGSHGKNWSNRFALGSVSSIVSQYAPCPVTIVRLPTVKTTASAGTSVRRTF